MIKPQTPPKFEKLEQIAYIPIHIMKRCGDDLEKALKDPDTQFGFVTSKLGAAYFCRYWMKTDPDRLRTLGASELTDERDLVAHESHTRDQVVTAWAGIMGDYRAMEEAINRKLYPEKRHQPRLLHDNDGG